VRRRSPVPSSCSFTRLGEVSIVDPATAATVATIDGSVGELAASLAVPLSLGKPYYLVVKHPATAAGSNDFYFQLRTFGDSNPLEAETTSQNNQPAGAEALMAVAYADGSTSYFIEGDLLPAGTDVDHFSVAVPPSMAGVINVACAAQRSGSGLRGLTATVLDSLGTPVGGPASASEAAASDLLVSTLPVPIGATSRIIKLEAASQAPDVLSAFYRCGIHFLQQ
jgi:hypothetical protein